MLTGGCGAGRGSRELLHGDMPVDDNEPRYCTCKQVSFGEMVACDNDDVRAPPRQPDTRAFSPLRALQCPYEWFHYSCVGLTEPPQGGWMCDTCKKAKRRRK